MGAAGAAKAGLADSANVIAVSAFGASPRPSRPAEVLGSLPPDSPPWWCVRSVTEMRPTASLVSQSISIAIG